MGLDISGDFSAVANLDAQAQITFAGEGGLNATTNSYQVAFLTAAITGVLNANPTNDKPVSLSVAVAGSFYANIINSRATTTITFAGASAFNANAFQGQSAVVSFDGAAVLSADAAFGVLPTIDVTGELVLIGNQPASANFIFGDDVVTKDTRYIYLGFDRVISGKPALDFLSSHSVDLTVEYPIAQIGTRNVFNHQEYFPANTYIKCPLDITKLLSSAGVWSVAAYTIGAALPAGNTLQYFYVSVED